MTKTWEIDRLLPLAKDFYSAFENKQDCQIHHPLSIRRYFIQPEDATRAARKIKNPRFSPYLRTLLTPGEQACAIKDSFGSIHISEGHWVNVPEFLNQLKSHFQKKALLIESAFDYTQLQALDESEQANWDYRGLRAQYVVFCEGIHSLENPFFKHLSLTPIKGELLYLEIPELQLSPGLYHKRRWLQALPNTNTEGMRVNPRFRLGATYEEGASNLSPSSAAKTTLLESLEAMTDHKASILEHKVGIRPSTPDALPIIAQHPQHPSLFAINGLGSKGTASAPYLAKQLLQKLGYEN